MKFRNDINFLRFFAVTSVVLYHFFPSFFPGGFIGVDVFFVISGFLMTGIIISKIERNRFSLLGFYSDRVKRIYPPLLVLTVVLIFLGLLYLPAFDLKQLVKHSASSLLFLSNYIYFNEAGYFDASSLSKYMLHTWSLSVEWQFYMLFPIFILLVNKNWSTNGVFLGIISLLLFSFFVSVYYTYQSPTSAYYLLESRAWQLLSGAVVFFLARKYSFQVSNKLVYTVVILLITLVFIVDGKMRWPGLAGVVPILFCSLIIFCNRELTIYSNKFISFIGKSSYSIYLWHWPVVVIFYKFYPDSLMFGVFLSWVLGSISYLIIERRFKFNNISLLGSGLLVTIFCSFIFLLGGKVYWLNDHFRVFDKTASSSPFRGKCHSTVGKEISPFNSCSFVQGPVHWAVLGDSHGVELAYSLSKQLRSESVEQFTYSSCPPSYGQNEQFSPCSKWYNDVVSHLLDSPSLKNIVIVHRYSAHLIEGANTNNKPDQILNSLELLVDRLKASGKNVFILNPVPEIEKTASDLVLKAYFESANFNDENVASIKYEDYLKRNYLILKFISRLAENYDVNIVDTQMDYCDGRYCFAVNKGKALYFDNNHPSIYGASLIAERLLAVDK
ncbi:acyltransferase family protein [Shewanella chilikensis]|uniref:acyltransferase family protein n=1 Tax=Shewanella chilikensis TaxID=558541 RepID=UPI001CD1BB32|nr:acyltransferase family protein [Shewanella chilikensis]MCA0950246.1 acyltransferase [Shewanella chilikensis]